MTVYFTKSVLLGAYGLFILIEPVSHLILPPDLQRSVWLWLNYTTLVACGALLLPALSLFQLTLGIFVPVLVENASPVGSRFLILQ